MVLRCCKMSHWKLHKILGKRRRCGHHLATSFVFLWVMCIVIIYRLNTCFQLKRKPYRCAIDYRYRLQVILILKKNGLRLQKKIILLKIKSNTSSHLNESRALYNYAYIFIVNIDYIYIFPFISPIFSHGASQAII